MVRRCGGAYGAADTCESPQQVHPRQVLGDMQVSNRVQDATLALFKMMFFDGWGRRITFSLSGCAVRPKRCPLLMHPLDLSRCKLVPTVATDFVSDIYLTCRHVSR